MSLFSIKCHYFSRKWRKMSLFWQIFHYFDQKVPKIRLFMGSHGSHRAFSRLPYASHGSHRAWSKEPYVRKSPISCISKMWPFSLQIEDLLKDSKSKMSSPLTNRRFVEKMATFSIWALSHIRLLASGSMGAVRSIWEPWEGSMGAVRAHK